MRNLDNQLRLEDAQTMTEYARTLSVITIFCLAAFALVAAASTGALTHVAGYLT
jgi:Flp pilus assembly pilin Flp